MLKTSNFCCLFIGVFLCGGVAEAASFYDQQWAQEQTAQAIARSQAQYEKESKAVQDYVNRANKEQQDRYAQMNGINSPACFLEERNNKLDFDLWASPAGSPYLNSQYPYQSGQYSNQGAQYPEARYSAASYRYTSGTTSWWPSLQGGVSDSAVMPMKVAPTPILALMKQTENELLQSHETDRIGSFDMDSFTGRLLDIKRNYSVMTSSSQCLSQRQENELRKELGQLRHDLVLRRSGLEL